MALKTDTREIQGEDGPVLFRVSQLPFKDARKLFFRLARILGPSLATLAEGVKSVDDLPLAAMVTKAIELCTDREVDEVADLLATVSEFSEDQGEKWPRLLFVGPGGKVAQDNRDRLFGGQLTLFFKWLWFALEVQFGDFSKALGKRAEGSAPGSEGQTQGDTKGSTNS